MGNTTVSPALLDQIARAIQTLRYGTVQVTVHDARVVQIEKHERIRIASTDLTTGSPPQDTLADRISGDHREHDDR